MALVRARKLWGISLQENMRKGGCGCFLRKPGLPSENLPSERPQLKPIKVMMFKLLVNSWLSRERRHIQVVGRLAVDTPLNRLSMRCSLLARIPLVAAPPFLAWRGCRVSDGIWIVGKLAADKRLVSLSDGIGLATLSLVR